MCVNLDRYTGKQVARSMYSMMFIPCMYEKETFILWLSATRDLTYNVCTGRDSVSSLLALALVSQEKHPSPQKQAEHATEQASE